jgi:hypothetical protein
MGASLRPEAASAVEGGDSAAMAAERLASPHISSISVAEAPPWFSWIL